MVQVAGICEACGKPVAKTGTMTQWVFRPTETCSCATTSVKGSDLRSCPVCGQLARSRHGTMTQWIFQQKSCNCLSTALDMRREIETKLEFPGDDAIEGNTYEWLGECGKGAFATVYKAKDRKLGRFVAIKVPHDRDAATDARFLREAKASSKLYHPNIVSVLDVGTLKTGRKYLVSEWIDGITLAQYLERHGTLKIDSATEIFCQVLDALSHAHRNEVIHRDIKPSNIMLGMSSSGGWSVKVIDFGSAKQVDKDGYTTKVDELACSPFYMSPEQVTDAVLDQRTDLYSFGCTLFETLTGRVPFQGQALSVVMRHQTDAPRTLRVASGGNEFPMYLEQLVARLLEKNPDSRFQTADEVKESLLSKKESPIDAPPTITGKNRKPAPWTVPAIVGASALFGVIAVCVFGSAGDKTKTLEQIATEEKKKKQKEEVTSLVAPSRIFGGRVKYTINNKHTETNLVNDDLSFLANKPVTFLGVQISAVGGTQMPLIGKMKTLSVLLMDMSTVSDAELKYIAPLRLRRLSIGSNPILGPGLKYINFERLESLNVSKTDLEESAFDLFPHSDLLGELHVSENKVSNAGLRKLIKKFPNLAILSLRKTGITDSVMLDISTLANLEHLSIERTDITDVGLKHLYGCKKLTRVDLKSSKVTSEGIADLKRHFPDIIVDEIERNNESAEILFSGPPNE